MEENGQNGNGAAVGPRGLNGNTLKYIAALAMLLDHVAMLFLPEASPWSIVLRTVGRLTCPVMCFLLAEGFCHTSSRKKYALRLGLFALIAQPAYAFAHEGNFSTLFTDWNMLFTLLLSFCMLWGLSDLRRSGLKILAACLCVVASVFCDWGVTAPLFVGCFWLLRGDRNKQALFYVALTAWYVLQSLLFSEGDRLALRGLGLLLFLPFLFLYNGERGSRNPFHKWFFYLFYPLHLLALGLICWL